MKNALAHTPARARRATLLLVVLMLALALLAVSHKGRAQTPQTGRPRRAAATTPTPTPARQTPAPRPTPGRVPQGQVVLPDTPPDMPNPVGQEIGEEGTLKIDTELVNLNVRVIDRNNRPINDVRQDEIRVFENGVPQQVFSFSREEVPISYGLAIDTSGSLRAQLPQVIEAGKVIINSNKPGDETFLVRFISSDKIEQVQDFTSKKEDLLDALETFYTEGGQTAILDAVYVSAEHVAEYKKGDDNDRRRRALIVVTDGEERGSTYKKEELFARLREADVQIYVIGFVGELEKEGGFIRKSKHDEAVDLLNRLAKETGGRAFFPESLSDLPKISAEIVRDLRTQYVVSYSPTNKERDGSYRAIRVTIADTPGKDKRIALTRAGRIAGREGGMTRPAATTAPAIRGNARPAANGRNP
ncbi:MAG TPA: VWA domain-containing protein [Pyrinomonadaceae bacterium]|jgi:Ca-activated chloride channel family protein